MKRLSLVLLTVLACKTAGTDTKNPDDKKTDASVTDGSDGEKPPGSDGEKPPGEDGEKPPGDPPAEAGKVCDAEVSDPKSFFADNVLIRLPKGVELVEDSPIFARITSKNTVSVCDAIVSYAALGYFQSDPKKTMQVIRDETIAAARGFQASEVTWADEAAKNRDLAVSYEVPEGPKGEPPIKGWLVLKERQGVMFWAAFETHPNAWNAMKKSFEESGKRLLITKK